MDEEAIGKISVRFELEISGRHIDLKFEGGFAREREKERERYLYEIKFSDVD